MKLFVLAGLFVGLCEGLFGWGSCPQPELVGNFEGEAYMGRWFEGLRVEDMPFQHGECDMAEYTLQDDGYIKVVNSEFYGGTWKSAQGEAYCEESGHCHVRFSSWSPWADYKVLDTDYKSYSVVYSCSSFYLFHIHYAWVLERKQGTNDLQKFLSLLKQLEINSSDLHFTDHSECPLSNIN